MTKAEGHIAGTKSPFRYRGYYFDAESGMYYLGSRYYDPEIGRFISPDVFISTGQGFVGYNMFAYCNNNPVNSVDSSGSLPLRTNNVLMADSGKAINGYYSQFLLQKYENANKYGVVDEVVSYKQLNIDSLGFSGTFGASLSHTEISNESKKIILSNDTLHWEISSGLGI